MSTVNIYNYEAILLDFAEGRLSAAQTNELFDFLAAHPELQDDFDAALAMTTLEDDEALTFSRKEDLLQNDNADFLQNLIIAEVEGVADRNEKLELEAALKTQPNLENELSIFEKLKFEADTTFAFSRKEALIQPVVVRFSTWVYSVSFSAAAVLLLFLVINGMDFKTNPNYTGVKLDKFDTLMPDQLIDVTPKEQLVAKDNSALPLKKRIQKQRKTTTNQTENYTAATENRTIQDYKALAINHAQNLNLIIDSELVALEIEIPAPKSTEKPERYVTSFLDEIAAQSTRIQTTYGFAGDVVEKVKNMAGDFNKYDEVELKFWGMHTTIRKPSWMKWRRTNDKL